MIYEFENLEKWYVWGIMGKKIIVLYRNYKDKSWQGSFQTNSYLSFVFNLFFLKARYELIDITIRK